MFEALGFLIVLSFDVIPAPVPISGLLIGVTVFVVVDKLGAVVPLSIDSTVECGENDTDGVSNCDEGVGGEGDDIAADKSD